MNGRPYLRCLGQPALYSPVGESIRIRTKKHLALLIYLAVEGRRTHRRDRLAELLWPDVSLPEARHSLATALSILRPRLGPGAIDATRDQVTLAEGCVSLDLDRLLAGEIMATATQEALEVAEFLDGFDIPDAAEYGLWKDRQRARLLPAIRAALVQLIDRCRRTADSRQIEHLADTMLTLDDLSEEAVRAKMEARALAGDRLTALRIFEEWKGRLVEAVGAQPSEIVEAMATRLRRRGWERNNGPEVPSVQTDQWRDRCFVGRSSAFQCLYEAWERARKGVASHVLVLGDSGIGKSTLVDRLTTAAGLEGAACSRAQCYDLEQEIPYAALGNLVRGLLDQPGVSGTPPQALAELALTIRDVSRKFPTIPPASESLGDTSRLRLVEAFRQMLEAISEDHPVILVVDDLHLCDEASLSVLHLIAHQTKNQALMLILVARPGELLHSPHAARLRGNARVLGISEVALAPLSENESGQLLISLLGPRYSGTDPTWRRALIRAAGGIPMILELLVQDWHTNGDRSLALTLEAMTPDFGTSIEVPPIYRQVFERLVFALDSGTRRVLTVAAVLGHRLNELSLYSIADVGQGQVMSAMADLVRRRVLRDGGHGLEFVNEFVRTAAYLDSPSTVRRAIHSSIAQYLMAEDARGVAFSGLEIAWHATRAGNTQGASAHLLKGAQEAAARGALDAAAHSLQTALPQLEGEDRLAACLLLGEVMQGLGRWDDSRRILHENPVALSTAIGTILCILAEHRTMPPLEERLRSDVVQLLTIASTNPVARIRLKAANTASQLMGDLRDPAMSDMLLRVLDEVRRDELTEDEMSLMDLCRAQLLYYSGQPDAVLGELTRLADSLRCQRRASLTLVRAYAGMGTVYCHQGNYDLAKREYMNGNSLAISIGTESQEAMLCANIALCCLRLGEYADALCWARKVPSNQQSGYLGFQLAYYKSAAMALLGDPKGAAQTMASVLPLDSVASPPWLPQTWQLFTADVLGLCGHQSAALAKARQATIDTNFTLHSPSFAGIFARWLALVAIHDGRINEARPVLEDLGERSGVLDAFDRAEITCARLIANDNGGSRPDLLGQLRQQLAPLPPAVADYLERLWVLRLPRRLDSADFPNASSRPTHSL